MLIPRDVVEEIRVRNDITDVVGKYVNLKRAGSNYLGLCPFHTEKTPSFTVFPSTQTFHCFGCGAGGDVVTFIMKSENLDYPLSLEFLAKQSGITIPTDTGQYYKGMTRNRVFEMNLAAAKYFRQCLFDPVIGSVGMNYLKNERKLSDSVIKHFGIGFAPNGYNGFTAHMKKLGFKENELVEGFLCGKSEKTGKAYDYFRNRVIFPILDTSGNVIAFGGRVMDDSKPKYLNSSDTPGFKKSRNLFALNYAKNHCSEKMILCEGYMDVIAMHAAGFENAVATLGTALTSEQARIMAKYTKQVVISYDSDEAGQKAASRALRMLSEAGLDVKVLKIQDAKDPDEYIKKYGKEKFAKMLNESKAGFDFRMDSILSFHDLTVYEEKIKASDELSDYISGINSKVEQDVYINRVASKLNISPESLQEDVRQKTKKRQRDYYNRENQNARMSAMGVGDRINPDTIKNKKAVTTEEAIIGLLMMFDEYRNDIIKGKIELSPGDFVTDFNRRVFEKIMELQNEDGGFVFTLLGEFFTPDEMGRIQMMEQSRRFLNSNGREVLISFIDVLKKENEIKKADSEDGIDAINRILSKKRNYKLSNKQ